MRQTEKLQQLSRLSILIRDRDLTLLKLASAQKARTEADLFSLSRSAEAPHLDPVIAAQVFDRFGLWTTNSRILLNQRLARDTVLWMSATSAAQRSFGRAFALDKLIQK